MATTWQLPYFNIKLVSAMQVAAGGSEHAELGMTITIDSDDPAVLAMVELAAARHGVVLERLVPVPASTTDSTTGCDLEVTSGSQPAATRDAPADAAPPAPAPPPPRPESPS